MKKLTKTQIQFLEENASMDAYAGVRLTAKDVEELKTKELPDDLRKEFAHYLRSYNWNCDNWMLVGPSYKERIKSAFYEITNICKKALSY